MSSSRVNGSVMARIVVPIQAILHPLQGSPQLSSPTNLSYAASSRLAPLLVGMFQQEVIQRMQMQHIQDTVSFEILQCVVFSLSSGRFLCVALPLVSEKREKIAILAAAELEPSLSDVC